MTLKIFGLGVKKCSKPPLPLLLGSLIETSSQGSLNSFLPNDSVRNILGLNATTLYEKYNLSQNSIDILSFDIFFLKCDIAQGMIFRGKQSGIFHNFTMVVDPGNKYVENFRGGVQWYMMGSKDCNSIITFDLENENENIVSLNGQNITLRSDYYSKNNKFYPTNTQDFNKTQIIF